MSDEKLVSIAEKLIERSELGEIAWADTADESTFSVAFPDYSISISRPLSWDTNTTLSIHNERGTIVESLDSLTSPENLQLLNALFDLARRTGLKTDEVLDDLLERLSR